MLGASFAPLYVTPVQFVSGTAQTAEYFQGQVFSTVTVSVVNDPIMESATGNLFVSSITNSDFISYFTVDGLNTNLPFNDPNIPPNSQGVNLSFAPHNLLGGTKYYIIGYSSAGILVDAGGDVGNTPLTPTWQPYFLISWTNLGLNAGEQLTFSRYGVFNGTLGSGVPPLPSPTLKFVGTNSNDIFDALHQSYVGQAFYGPSDGRDIINGLGGNDRISGLIGDDALFGGKGNDALYGGPGNDALYGGAGKDTLTGGADYDFFVFNTAPNALTNVDRIIDFSVAYDTIVLENAVMRGLGSHVGTLASRHFWKSKTGLAHDANDRIIYETDTGWLNYDSNGSAAGGAVHIAHLAPKLPLTHADFWVI
jgi:Ca2+-binding RTX toxin-like protein